MLWTILNFLIIVSPVMLIWGWLKYLQVLRQNDRAITGECIRAVRTNPKLVLVDSGLLIRSS